MLAAVLMPLNWPATLTASTWSSLLSKIHVVAARELLLELVFVRSMRPLDFLVPLRRPRLEDAKNFLFVKELSRSDLADKQQSLEHVMPRGKSDG